MPKLYQPPFDIKQLRADRNKQLRADRAKGMTYEALAKKYNVHWLTAHRICKK